MEDLAGRVAVVTGGAGGIGRAIAHAFGEAGMSVAIADLDTEALAAAGKELARTGVDVLTVPVDVRSEHEMDRLAQTVLGRFGAAHVICNNAGVAPLGGVAEMSTAEFRWVVDVNVYGVLHGIRAFLPTLEDQGAGHVVNVASVSGLLTQPGAAAYNASKFAVVALSESLYQELQLRRSPVGVSLVCPATVQTGIFDADRHRPDGVVAAEGPVARRARTVMSDLAAKSHRTTGDVAAAVVAAVRSNDFYVFTHPGIIPFVKQRNEDIEMQRNPSLDQGF